MSQPEQRKRTKWDELCELLQRRPRRLAILTHNNPDSDAIGAAAGLKFLLRRCLGLRAIMYHGGMISRAENRALIDNCRIDIRALRDARALRNALVILVDSQPGARNNALAGRLQPSAAIDHHVPLRKETPRLPFHDVRADVGSTCTILTGYFQQAGLEPDRRTATAMYYGILSDIGDIGRDKLAVDIHSMQWLHGHISERLLLRITHPRLTPQYYGVVTDGIRSARIHGDAVVCELGNTLDPDAVAELSDFLLKLEGMRWSFVCGILKDELLFSIRTTDAVRNAGKLAFRLSRGRGDAGGHQHFAGGALALLPAPSAEEQSATLVRRFLRLINAQDAEGRPILDRTALSHEARAK